MDSAAPALQHNVIEANETGIRYFGTIGGQAIENQIRSNRTDGVSVRGGSPTLTENDISANGGYGIYWSASGNGPQGLFLKRTSGAITFDGASGFPWLRRVRPEESRLYYAKPFVHPLFAAPFVLLLGTRGLMLANGLLLASALWLSFAVLRRRGHAPGSALATAIALPLLAVVPVYLVWPTPEIFGFALVTAGLAAWAAGRPLLSALLFGIAGYLKPPNVLMAAPLGLEPLLPAAGERWLGPSFGRRLRESLRRGAVLAVAAGSFYALNAAFTGELNYQGGERKTFYGRFPFDATGATFDDSGIWMTTNQVGPLVAGQDEERLTAASAPARDAGELRESLLRNLGYFWFGRFGGVLAYFFPALVALGLFLVVGPRDRVGWLCVVAIALSWLAYIRVIPDNWYGGGGTIGNRYFLGILPGFLFLVPPRRGPWLALAGLLAMGVFLAPVLASPIRHSLAPGRHALAAPFRALPAELTMLNDLSIFTEAWRKKRPFGFTGDATKHADADAYFLYFMDDGSWGKEEWGGRAGFWLRGSASAEVVVRAFDIAPLDKIKADGDELVGVNIVKRALEEPARQIAHNAGHEGAVVIGKIRDSKDENFGFNADTGEYGDMVKAGVIDPAKVTRLALQNAASIAGVSVGRVESGRAIREDGSRPEEGRRTRASTRGRGSCRAPTWAAHAAGSPPGP
jgi:hypothetical protein